MKTIGDIDNLALKPNLVNETPDALVKDAAASAHAPTGTKEAVTQDADQLIEDADKLKQDVENLEETNNIPPDEAEKGNE